MQAQTLVMDNVRKRQRRQATGNMVVSMFNRGSASNSSTSTSAMSKAKGKKKQSTAQPRPKVHVPPRGIGPVREPNENDVLSGRGGRINAHVGNVQFREIVQEHKQKYLAKETKKLEKAHIAAELVYHIRSLDPPGRFLKEDPDGMWFDIGDAKAIKKVGQALREDAEIIRGDTPDTKKAVVKAAAEADDTDAKPAAAPCSSPKTVPVISSSSDNTPTRKIERGASTSTTSPAAAGGSPTTMPAPPIPTNAANSKKKKAVGAVSGRGGKLVHSRSGSDSPQNNVPQPLAYQEIAPPKGYHHVVPKPLPDRSGNPSHQQEQQQQQRRQATAPFHGSLGFRSMRASRSGAAISGAAAAVMKQQQYHFNMEQPLREFEVPGPPLEEAFGRPFHPADAPNVPVDVPPHVPVDSSLISGTGTASAVSGMSGISALTDPMSTLSNSESNVHNQSRTARQVQVLDQVRQNWIAAAPPASQAAHIMQGSATDLPTGNSMNNNNNSFARGDRRQAHFDSSVNWPVHSTLSPGGFTRDDSVFYSSSMLSGNGNLGSCSYGGLPATMRDDAFLASVDAATPPLYTTNSFGSSRQGGVRSAAGPSCRGQPRMYSAPTYNAAGDASVDPMSVTSNGLDSVFSAPVSVMSELSDNLNALDLAEALSILDSSNQSH